MNALRPKLFVEPFAGGASVALQLLEDGRVDQIALGERDPLVASFWKTVFFDSAWLVQAIQDVAVTLENWDFFKSHRFTTNRERALACLFLNRTSFSGIIAPSAGAIGGRAQKSDYPIDCRFPVATIVRRILQCAALGDRVAFVVNGDWRKTMRRTKSEGVSTADLLYYFDPPFFDNADRLYNFFFTENDHRGLHDTVVKLRARWLMSYDPADTIVKMYSHNSRGPRRISLLYSAAGNGDPRAGTELVMTNLPNLPKETRLWRSAQEWGKRRQT